MMERFWSKVTIEGLDDCWEWQAAKDSKGYGAFQVGTWRAKKLEGAHRMAWILTFGPIPEGQWVLHSCDNPACCNPRHLFLGDVLINNQDMGLKGRAKNGNTRLTPERANEIRARYIPFQRGYKKLAKEYGLSWLHIRSIIKERIW
jgi:hypothetical protein